MAGVRVARREKSITQGRLAELLGTSQAMVTSLETGRIRVNLGTAIRMQNALNTNIFDLIGIGRKFREDRQKLAKGIMP